MQRLRVHNFAVSIDGYAAGPGQDLENPLGRGGLKLHEWFFTTRTFRKTHGQEGGESGLDDDWAARITENVGAWIIGRNMFGPVRGPWPDERWRGWWGENPPFHAPVFVLTRHARPSLRLEGGTVFHFVDAGAEGAAERALASAEGRDVVVGGGVGTLHQFLRARLIDEMHIVISPVLLGSGLALFEGVDLTALGYAPMRRAASDKATHIVLERCHA